MKKQCPYKFKAVMEERYGVLATWQIKEMDLSCIEEKCAWWVSNPAYSKLEGCAKKVGAIKK